MSCRQLCRDSVAQVSSLYLSLFFAVLHVSNVTVCLAIENGTGLTGYEIYCISNHPNEKAYYKFLQNEDGSNYHYAPMSTWRKEKFCNVEIDVVNMYPSIGDEVTGQTFIWKILQMCQKMDPLYKWVQPRYGDSTWYLFMIGKVFFGRIWHIESKLANNNMWDEYGGGFLKETWELHNCAKLYGN